MATCTDGAASPMHAPAAGGGDGDRSECTIAAGSKVATKYGMDEAMRCFARGGGQSISWTRDSGGVRSESLRWNGRDEAAVDSVQGVTESTMTRVGFEASSEAFDDSWRHVPPVATVSTTRQASEAMSDSAHLPHPTGSKDKMGPAVQSQDNVSAHVQACGTHPREMSPALRVSEEAPQAVPLAPSLPMPSEEKCAPVCSPPAAGEAVGTDAIVPRAGSEAILSSRPPPTAVVHSESALAPSDAYSPLSTSLPVPSYAPPSAPDSARLEVPSPSPDTAAMRRGTPEPPAMCSDGLRKALCPSPVEAVKTGSQRERVQTTAREDSKGTARISGGSSAAVLSSTPFKKSSSDPHPSNDPPERAAAVDRLEAQRQPPRTVQPSPAQLQPQHTPAEARPAAASLEVSAEGAPRPATIPSGSGKASKRSSDSMPEQEGYARASSLSHPASAAISLPPASRKRAKIEPSRPPVSAFEDPILEVPEVSAADVGKRVLSETSSGTLTGVVESFTEREGLGVWSIRYENGEAEETDDCGELHDDMCAYFEFAVNAAAATGKQVKLRNNAALLDQVRARLFKDDTSVLGRRVVVLQDKVLREGEVTKYVQPTRDGEIEQWRVTYADGQYEDAESFELVRPLLRYIEKRIERREVEWGDRKLWAYVHRSTGCPRAFTTLAGISASMPWGEPPTED